MSISFSPKIGNTTSYFGQVAEKSSCCGAKPYKVMMSVQSERSTRYFSISKIALCTLAFVVTIAALKYIHDNIFKAEPLKQTPVKRKTLKDWLSQETDEGIFHGNIQLRGQARPIIAFGMFDEQLGLLDDKSEIKPEHYGYHESYNYLSNIFEIDIVVDGQTYQSVHNYVQTRPQEVETSTQVQALTAQPFRVNDNSVKIQIMKKALWAKFINTNGTPTEVGRQLMETQGRHLIKGNYSRDPEIYWGMSSDFKLLPDVVSFHGKNLLGKLLMEIRSILFELNPSK